MERLVGPLKIIRRSVMRGPRFSVQALLLGLTFVALCLACFNGYNAWYRQKHGDEFISIQLHSKVRNGDSVEHA